MDSAQLAQFFNFLSKVLSILEMAARSVTLRCFMVGKIGAGSGLGDGEGVVAGAQQGYAGHDGGGAARDAFGARFLQEAFL